MSHLPRILLGTSLLLLVGSSPLVAAEGGASQFPGAVLLEPAGRCTAATCSTGATSDGDVRLDPEVSMLSTPALAALIRAKAPMCLVDARDARWDDGHRIEGALALTIKDSDEAVKKALPRKSDLIVVYCGDLECPASRDMAERLGDMGYENVIEYPYGIDGWRKAGLPTKRVRRRRR